jgi:hypothetical protein
LRLADFDRSSFIVVPSVGADVETVGFPSSGGGGDGMVALRLLFK